MAFVTGVRGIFQRPCGEPQDQRMIAQALTGLLLHLVASSAVPLAGPTVTLDSATVLACGLPRPARAPGTSDGKTSKFLGVPFAQSPVGDLRFRLPQSLPSYQSNFKVTNFGLSCMQQAITFPILKGAAAEVSNQLFNSLFNKIFPDSEDLDIRRYTTFTGSTFDPGESSGGFQIGGSSHPNLIPLLLGMTVSDFYRAKKQGKMASLISVYMIAKREALRGVQKYISQFGGDPAKVTIWSHFNIPAHVGGWRRITRTFARYFYAIGSPIPIGDIRHGQKYYDSLVRDTGCSAPRRWLLQHTVGKQNIWGFVHKRLEFALILGAFHTSDLLDVYGGGEMADYLNHFVNTLDPNRSGALQWPQYTSQPPGP
ncbi:hypothetical protein K443DRAFT_635057 [Laccaria amethystina LaAM-08-1]|uniref:Carboxylesterase type B domain-containing protein n=1 Tax=Laccaria amethystina LaAM-08-1 TaxID=1095629 RepID=A0A0C9XM89_9AGAR|nr:hypothetical protein K443DRAFT_635057 [Laccaria amethystina LaAM-08-1]